ncbi:Mpv17-like protein [Morella rubra]|uniref:Mpv17-like protein n=1 Tax=Morella rubra TaxID=262757 RepID=A0A6A1UW12_9ROSI|nr:Mpv17-like protein [Morella rubra]
MGSYFFTKVSKCSSLRRSGTRLFVAHVRILTAEAQSLTKHQQGRAYAQFPGQLSKTRGPNTPSSPLRPFSSSTPPSSYSKAGFVGWYLSMLESRPLFTKSVSSCLIYAAADLTSQILPKRDIVTIMKKIVVGQVIYGPSITTIFFSYNAVLRGESAHEIVARLKRDLLPTFKTGVLYWPICDFLTFKFVPVHLQPLMNSTCSYVWTVYLTYMASLKKVGPSCTQFWGIAFTGYNSSTSGQPQVLRSRIKVYSFFSLSSSSGSLSTAAHCLRLSLIPDPYF